MTKNSTLQGIFIAITLIACWGVCLYMLLKWQFSWNNPLVYFMVLVQMHLYTGLFITAHDAMHGTVSANKTVNTAIGQVCAFLYALFPYRKLYTKHHQHHQHVHTGQDPDYHEGSFVTWYVRFIAQYLSWWQILCLAALFNIFKLAFPEQNLILFWVLPSLLSTLQLFYFGTWLPHHGEHSNKHHSRTQRKNHPAAFLSCYFFGYHYEHHEHPGIPWWKLWQMR